MAGSKMSGHFMTIEEAEHYIFILKRPCMHLGESPTFTQVVFFILGMRYAHAITHNFAFGTFDDFVWSELGIDGSKHGWAEILIEKHAAAELSVGCHEFSSLLEKWVSNERATNG